MAFMETAANPFTPSFGSRPPFLVGRGGTLSEIQRALQTGPRHPGFASLLLGPRGTGKTTLLLEACDQAEAAGWVACKADALVPNADVPLHQALLDVTLDQIDTLRPADKRAVTGLQAGPLSASWNNLPAPQRSSRRLQRALGELANLVTEQGGAGVLAAVDEFHNLRAQDASVIASAIQQLAKDQDKPVALLGAGLAHVEHTLLPHKGFTFFQRCKRHRILNLSLLEAKEAILVPLDDGGMRLRDDLLCRAAVATNGHPYAIQSFGFHLWEAAHQSTAIDTADVDEAIERMDGDMTANVLVPIWDRLTPKSRDFLAAMSADDGPSRVADVAARLGATPNLVNNYRRRLIDEGVISAAGYGLVDFANDRIREAAREHQAELDAFRTGSK